MKIHTVTNGETVHEIAKKYGVAPTKIIENNGLKFPDRLTVGQKLLILTPTRTYTVRGGDTVEKICARFATERAALYKNNPALWESGNVYPEQVLALKYDTPMHGDLSVNGYFYSGCKISRLREIIPYLNYLTVSAAVAEKGRLRRLTDDAALITEANAHGVKALFRIYDTAEYSEVAERDAGYIKSVAELVKKLGYSGIVAVFPNLTENEFIGEVLESYKSILNEYELLLFCEVDGNKKYKPTHSADGYLFSYEKCQLKDIPAFAEGEAKAYAEYSEKQDTQYSFIDLPSVAFCESGEIPYSSAEDDAVRNWREIKYDCEKMICKYERKRRSGEESVIFPSLENIKARLEVCSKLGFCGVSIDIMRSSTAEIMLLSKSSVSPKCNL